MKNGTIHFEALQTETESTSQEDSESSPFYHPQVREPSWICVEILREGIRHASADWKILVCGQLLSFLLASGGAAQATLALNCKLSAPSLGIGLQYFILSFSLIPLYLQGRRQRAEDHDRAQEILSDRNGDSNFDSTGTTSSSSAAPYSFFLGRLPLHIPAWRYFLMAIMDVYANYFTVLAFRFTTITSVTVFDALAIPSSMILSRCFLSRRYTWIHLLGVASCMAGIIFNVLQDYEDDTNTGNDDAIARAYPHKLRGDCLSITGGILFGANNVLGEAAVRNNGGVNEYLGMLGFFASIICLLQILILERREIYEFFGSGDNKTCSQTTAQGLLFGYVCAVTLLYMGSARFLKVSESTFLNLSFLTGDLWSVTFSVVAEKIVPKPLFFVALVFIVSGVFVYELAPTPVLEDRVHLDSKDSWRDGDLNEVELQVQNGNHSAEHAEANDFIMIE